MAGVYTKWLYYILYYACYILRISMRIRDWSPHANGNKSAVDDRQAHGHQYISEELEKTGR